MDKCRVELVYDAMGKPFPIGVTFDLRTIVMVKRQILKEAEEDYEGIKDVDQVLCMEHWGNLKRLKGTLDLLIPPETEELVLQGNGDRRG
jgi:hypothetical protein